MNGYFLNTELKRSSLILVASLILFALLTLVALDVHHQRLKADYLNLFGAMASRVLEKAPDLKNEIMPFLMKEITTEELAQGGELMRQYGLTTDLERGLFPYLDATFQRNTRTLLAIFSLLAVIFFWLNYMQYAFFYGRIRRVTHGARRIIEGDFDIAINEDVEGDFAKLANAFNSMRKIIVSHLASLQREKQFLVDLMSDISHQLKTPLSSLILYNDIMLTKDLTLDQRETFLRKKQDQLERMKWLIFSLLKMARLDAKSIEFEREEQSLNETIAGAIKALESKAREAKVAIHFIEEAEVQFAHDRQWLEEALINLLKNGIEHTPAGGAVAITVTENPLYRRILVTDTGEGISEAELLKIFKRFYKVPNSRKSDSLGIGLALARSIIEAHQGVIEAHSQVGVGTKFVITFLK